MKKTEEQLAKELSELIELQKNCRIKFNQLKKDLIDTESDLIEININLDRAKEALRIFRYKKVDHEISDRDEDIERFKKALPSIMKDLK